MFRTGFGLCAWILGSIVIAGMAGAQVQLPPSCPATDMNVKVVKIPHRESVEISMPSNSGEPGLAEVFTSVPSGMNFNVTHISGRFSSSSASGPPQNSYLLELFTTVSPPLPQVFLASMVPTEVFPLSKSTSVRTLNLPFDANYLNDRTYMVQVRRSNVQAASTIRVTFDGYLEPDCGDTRVPR